MPHLMGGNHPNPWVNEYREWLVTRPQANAMLEERARICTTKGIYVDSDIFIKLTVEK